MIILSIVDISFCMLVIILCLGHMAKQEERKEKIDRKISETDEKIGAMMREISRTKPIVAEDGKAIMVGGHLFEITKHTIYQELGEVTTVILEGREW